MSPCDVVVWPLTSVHRSARVGVHGDIPLLYARLANQTNWDVTCLARPTTITGQNTRLSAPDAMARKRKNPHRATRPQGFDYGLLPSAMAVGSFGFPGHLTAASVDAVAYGVAWSNELKKSIPSVSLLAQHGNELQKAFAEFSAWSQATDPDSVDLRFIFLNNGGYVLGISPEYSRLRRRCLDSDRAHRVLVCNGTWFKRMDSLHPALRELREYSSQSIAPFSFSGATYFGPRNALTRFSPPEILPLTGIDSLLKFEVTFVDEDNVVPHTIEWVGAKLQSPQSLSAAKPPRLDVDDIAKQRRNVIACHFPVTVERIRRRGDVLILMRHFIATDVRPWQIEQALCNLVIGSETGQGRHFAGLSSRKVIKHVALALHSRCELADGRTLSTFTVDEVRTQIVADGNALLRYFDKKKRPNLAAVQAGLSSLRALRAEAVGGSTLEGTLAG